MHEHLSLSSSLPPPWTESKPRPSDMFALHFKISVPKVGLIHMLSSSCIFFPNISSSPTEKKIIKQHFCVKFFCRKISDWIFQNHTGVTFELQHRAARGCIILWIVWLIQVGEKLEFFHVFNPFFLLKGEYLPRTSWKISRGNKGVS